MLRWICRCLGCPRRRKGTRKHWGRQRYGGHRGPTWRRLGRPPLRGQVCKVYMCHLLTHTKTELGSLRNSISRVIPRTNDRTRISVSWENFGHEDLSFPISKRLHISGLRAAQHPWPSLLTCWDGSGALWRAPSPGFTYLGRVALFPVAVHSLYLLHVEHFRVRSCETPATREMSDRLFTN